MMIRVKEVIFNQPHPPEVKFYGVDSVLSYGHYFPAGGLTQSNQCAVCSKSIILAVFVIPAYYVLEDVKTC